MEALASRLQETAAKRTTKFKTHKGDEFDRSAFLTGSEAWNCARQIWFSKHRDVDLKSGGWGYFERGHHMEDWVVDLIKEAGYELFYAGDEQVTLVLDRLSATPDGLLVDKDEHVVIEVKSIDPRSQQPLPKHEHVMQVQMQMVLFNRLDDFKATPKKAWIIYVDASDYSKIQMFEVKYDPGAYVGLVDRANMILKANDPMNVPAEGKVDGSCKFCRFTEECGEAIIESLPFGSADLEGSDESALMGLCDVRTQWHTAEKNAAKERKTIEENIKELMTKLNRALAEVGKYRVSYTEVAGRRTLDKVELEKDFGDLEDYYKVGKPTTRLSITGG